MILDLDTKELWADNVLYRIQLSDVHTADTIKTLYWLKRIEAGGR